MTSTANVTHPTFSSWRQANPERAELLALPDPRRDEPFWFFGITEAFSVDATWSDLDAVARRALQLPTVEPRRYNLLHAALEASTTEHPLEDVFAGLGFPARPSPSVSLPPPEDYELFEYAVASTGWATPDQLETIRLRRRELYPRLNPRPLPAELEPHPPAPARRGDLTPPPPAREDSGALGAPGPASSRFPTPAPAAASNPASPAPAAPAPDPRATLVGPDPARPRQPRKVNPHRAKSNYLVARVDARPTISAVSVTEGGIPSREQMEVFLNNWRDYDPDVEDLSREDLADAYVAVATQLALKGTHDAGSAYTESDFVEVVLRSSDEPVRLQVAPFVDAAHDSPPTDAQASRSGLASGTVRAYCRPAARAVYQRLLRTGELPLVAAKTQSLLVEDWIRLGARPQAFAACFDFMPKRADWVDDPRDLAYAGLVRAVVTRDAELTRATGVVHLGGKPQDSHPVPRGLDS